MKSVPQVVSDYFDGDLSSHDQAELRRWLFERPLNVKAFVVHSFVHSQLIDWIGPEPTRVNRIVAAEVVPSQSPVPAPVAARSKARSIAGRALVLAAMLAGLFAIGYMFSDRFEAVASVSGTRNVHWANGANPRNVGSLLHAGDELTIEDGLLHIVFARGGQVAVHGPATFRIESDMEGRLVKGRLCALTPEHARGFTIHTARMAAVDLGTEFYLESKPDDSCALQVFEGLVEVQLDGRSNAVASDEKLQIPQGRAIRFDAATGKVTSIEYDKSKRLPETTWSQ
jgi:ferric-dicitrate binding protein FerR (iron transport regulator)